MPLNVKRVYEAPSQTDGMRILVDRLWPRGLAREKAKVDEWMKEIAPSDDLRRWFHSHPEKWGDFRRKYRRELHSSEKLEYLRQLESLRRRTNITLLYGSKDETHNNAVIVAMELKRR